MNHKQQLANLERELLRWQIEFKARYQAVTRAGNAVKAAERAIDLFRAEASAPTEMLNVAVVDMTTEAVDDKS